MSWTRSERRAGAKPALGASGKPVVASERDLAVQSAVFFKLGAVARAAEELFHAHQREMGFVGMAKYWLALEDALNAWRAGE
jgi:hypothetical protein